MKNKKRKIAFLAICACAFASLSVATTIAKADKVDVAWENKVYYGETIRLDNLDAFTQREITLGECGLESPLIEFVITPDQTGSAENYTPDFERMYIDIFDPTNADKKLSISIYEHYIVTRASDIEEKHIAINAAGSEQSLMAEWRGPQAKYLGVLGTGYGGNIAQSFDGYVHANSYIDENGMPIEHGSNRAIRLFYDMEENALFTDVGRSGENTQITMSNGKFRWRIRDFDKADYKDVNGELIDTTWAGFDEGDELEFSISFDKVKDEVEPSILLSKIAGESLLGSPIVVSTPAKGQKNLAYPIPKPIFYNESTYEEESFESIGGEYKIEMRLNNVRIPTQAYTQFRENATFTPRASGDYIITYKVGARGVEKAISVTVEDNPEKVGLSLNTLPSSCYIFDAFDIGVSCTYPSQTIRPNVYLEIFKDEQVFVQKFIIEENFDYKFDASGKYKLVYTSVDYLGREVREEKDIEVRRYYVSWAEGLKENISIPLGVKIEKPNVSNVKIFDILFNKEIEIQSCVISASFNGGSYESISTIDFSREGEYTIRYELQYDAYSIENVSVTRKIFVYNEMFDKINVNGLPYGTKLAEEPINDVEIQLKALKGKEIIIPYGYFNCDLTNVIFVNVDGTEQDITTTLKYGEFVFKPESVGIYEIVAILENEQYRAVKLLRFDVRDKWVSFSNIDDMTLPLDADVNDYLPTCQDFYGNLITDYTTQIYYMGKKVENAGSRLERLGVYEIVYTYANEQATATRKISTYDNVSPIIKLQDLTTRVYKGQIVELANFEITDDSNLVPTVVISVMKDGKNIDVFNNSFEATEIGEYVVTCFAVDSTGNAITEQYVVNVEDNTVLVGIIIGVVIGVAIMIGVTTFLIITRKKNRRK